MAYTPYSPDVQPPSPDDFIPQPPRRWPWVLLAVAVLGGLVALFWPRIKTMAPAKPPIATIALPDGTELRLVHFNTGNQITIKSSDNYEGRVQWEQPERGMFGGMGSRSSGWGVSGEDSPYMIFTRYDPATKTCSVPGLKSATAYDTDKRLIFQGRAVAKGGSGLPPVQGISFDCLPRRATELELSLDYDGQVVTAKIANPFHKPNVPAFVTKPLPQKAEVEGVTVDFQNVSVGTGTHNEDGKQWKKFHVSASITAKAEGISTDAFSVGRTVFDPTGNRSSYNYLPTSDAVWGVDVGITENHLYPFPPERIIVLGTLKVPAAGQITPLVIPEKFRATGVSEMFLFGAGSYQWADGKITGAATQGGKSEEVGKLSNPSQRSTASVNSTELRIFSNGQNSIHQLGGALRMAWKGKFFSSGSHGMSSSGNTRTEHHGYYNFPDNKPPQPGDEIELQYYLPKTRKAQFYFDRPPLPKE